MQKKYHCIALTGTPRHPNSLNTHETLYQWLTAKGYQVIVEENVAANFNIKVAETASLNKIGEQADLAIVIGGDGNMLGAARTLSDYDIDLIGVNRGTLGFLTALDPDDVEIQLEKVLAGHYQREHRFLLEVNVYQDGELLQTSKAVNEVVFHPNKVAHMIEFEVDINNQFAFAQRSDGLIISTPTGSTAYCLSAGGPILTPGLNAMALVPMFPHTLTSRPIVIDGDSVINLRATSYRSKLIVSCDSQTTIPLKKSYKVEVKRSQSTINLIQPDDYNYFDRLSSKLGWASKFF